MATGGQLINSLMKHIDRYVSPTNYTIKWGSNDRRLKTDLEPIFLVKGSNREYDDKSRIEVSLSKRDTISTSRLGNNSIHLIPVLIKIVLVNSTDEDPLDKLESALLDHEYIDLYNDVNGKLSSDRKKKFLRIANAVSRPAPIETSADSVSDENQTSTTHLFRVYIQNPRVV